MGLRIYMKSGNNYCVDISEYSYSEVCEQLSNTILCGDNYLIDAHGKTYFFKGAEIEYFEIDIAQQEELSNKNKIGFVN
jgi:hypothetical protein